jgi:hypothetical protein
MPKGRPMILRRSSSSGLHRRMALLKIKRARFDLVFTVRCPMIKVLVREIRVRFLL